MTERADVGSTRKFDAELGDWSVVVASAAFDPSRKEVRLIGQVFRDKRGLRPDGEWVITSRVRTRKRLIIAGALIATQNTRYYLLNRSVREDLEIE